MKKRVVITGMGVISALGNELEKFWDAIKNGKCGISTVTSFDASNLSTKVAAEVKDFDPTLYIDKKEVRRMDSLPNLPWQLLKWQLTCLVWTLKRWINIGLELL